MSPESSAAVVEGSEAAGLDLSAVRRAQAAWTGVSVRRRLQMVREVRHLIAENADRLADSVELPQRSSHGETLAAEVLPLADACRFLEQEAERLLAPRPLGRRGRPFWLGGSDVVLHREPFGVVLIVAPSNYPIFLPGVQLLQALVVGNAVVIKPGSRASRSIEIVVELLYAAGVDRDLVRVLDESPANVSSAIEAGVDKVLLTGSLKTGRVVLGQLTRPVIPAVMELSGCDAVIVREDANLELVARALAFGLTFNGSYTCIAPRRVFVARRRLPELEALLAARLPALAPIRANTSAMGEVRTMAMEAIASGARIAVGELPGSWSVRGMRPLVLAEVTPEMEVMRADVAAPVLSLIAVDSDEDALAQAAQCPYRLGGSVFGDPAAAAALAERMHAGLVVINDLIVPSADPRVPFAGQGLSGFGATRGAEGLLELTRTKSVIRRRGRMRPHFDAVGPLQEKLLAAFVQISHARTLARRGRAVLDAFAAMIAMRRPQQTSDG